MIRRWVGAKLAALALVACGDGAAPSDIVLIEPRGVSEEYFAKHGSCFKDVSSDAEGRILWKDEVVSVAQLQRILERERVAEKCVEASEAMEAQ